MVLLYCLLVGISGIMIMRRRLAQFFENCSSFLLRGTYAWLSKLRISRA